MGRRQGLAGALGTALAATVLVGPAPAHAAAADSRSRCVVKDSVRTCVVLHRSAGSRYFATASVRNLDSRNPTEAVIVGAKLQSSSCSTPRWRVRSEPEPSSGASSATHRTGSIAGVGRTLYRATVASVWWHDGESVFDATGDSTVTPLLGRC